jgi:hypothetical protein
VTPRQLRWRARTARPTQQQASPSSSTTTEAVQATVQTRKSVVTRSLTGWPAVV